MSMRKTLSRLMAATILMVSAGILAGCEEEQATKVWDMKTCIKEQSELFCKESFEQAKKLADANGPVYSSQEDCEAAHGKTGPEGQAACEAKGEFWTNADGDVLSKDDADKATAEGQTVTHHNSGFSPWVYYWLGQQNAQTRAYSNYAPVYTNSGGGYSTLSGKQFPSVGEFKATPSSVKVAPSSKPTRMFVNSSSARNGFSSVSRSFSFGG